MNEQYKANIPAARAAQPISNLALDECARAFTETTRQALKEGKSGYQAKEQGKIAYCSALPRLCGATNIRDFIACVTYAMALDIIPGNDATRLLYAAQVAHTALKRKSLKRGQSPLKSPTPSPGTSTESTT